MWRFNLKKKQQQQQHEVLHRTFLSPMQFLYRIYFFTNQTDDLLNSTQGCSSTSIYNITSL